MGWLGHSFAATLGCPQKPEWVCRCFTLSSSTKVLGLWQPAFKVSNIIHAHPLDIFSGLPWLFQSFSCLTAETAIQTWNWNHFASVWDSLQNSFCKPSRASLRLHPRSQIYVTLSSSPFWACGHCPSSCSGFYWPHQKGLQFCCSHCLCL